MQIEIQPYKAHSVTTSTGVQTQTAIYVVQNILRAFQTGSHAQARYAKRREMWHTLTDDSSKECRLQSPVKRGHSGLLNCLHITETVASHYMVECSPLLNAVEIGRRPCQHCTTIYGILNTKMRKNMKAAFQMIAHDKVSTQMHGIHTQPRASQTPTGMLNEINGFIC
jgi:hypothetical protein